MTNPERIQKIRELLKAEYPEPELNKNMPSYQPYRDIISLLSDIETEGAIERLLKNAAATVELCSQCDGKGWYEGHTQDDRGEIIPAQVQCEICNAFGIRIEPIVKPQSKQEGNPDELPF